MPGGCSKIACHHRSLAGVAVILVLITCGGIPGPAAAAPAEPILQLTPEIDRYFLGSYLAYLEDPQKRLTIDDVSSQQMSVAISLQFIVVPPIFLLAALICWRRGFRPGRFFLLAFAFLGLSAMYEALVIFGMLPYLTLYSGQFGSASSTRC